MLAVTILPDAIRRRGPWSLPNLLTYGRILAIPALVAILFWPRDDWMRWMALAIYTLAAITDYLDGYIARAWSQQSAIGRMLDPIADKILVTGTIVGLLASGTSADVVIPYGLILFREFAVSALRETTAGRFQLKVTMLAKWKTTLQLVALGAQLLALIWTGAEDNWMPTFITFADILVWVAALVTLWTGWQYFAKAREAMR